MTTLSLKREVAPNNRFLELLSGGFSKVIKGFTYNFNKQTVSPDELSEHLKRDIGLTNSHFTGVKTSVDYHILSR